MLRNCTHKEGTSCYRNYREEDLAKCLDLIIKNEMSIAAAAKAFNIQVY